MLTSLIILAFSYFVCQTSAAPAPRPTTTLEGRTTGPECDALPSPPPSAICGQLGGLQSPPTPTAAPGGNATTTLRECKLYCFHRTAPADERYGYEPYPCVALAYDQTSGLCTLYASSLTQLGFAADQSSDVAFYDIGCYTCGSYCPLTTSQNLLNNPGFESSSVYFGPWFAETPTGAPPLVKVVTPGHKSAHALSCTGECSVSQVRSTCERQTYNLSIDVMVVQHGSHVPKKAFNQFTFGAGDNYYFERFGFGVYNATWRTLTASLKAFKNYSEVRITMAPPIGVENKTIMYIDNAKLVPTDPKPATTGPSLLKNGGFESGRLEPWIFNYVRDGNVGHEHITSPGLGGSKYKFQFHQVLYGGDSANYGGFDLYQNITTIPGREYELSYEFISDPITSAPPGYRYELHPGYYISAGDWSWSAVTDPFNKTTTFKRTFAATTRSTQIIISYYDTGYYAFVQNDSLDNIRVRELA